MATVKIGSVKALREYGRYLGIKGFGVKTKQHLVNTYLTRFTRL